MDYNLLSLHYKVVGHTLRWLYHFFGVAANVVLSTKFVWPDH
jgi:hypothetical protein